MPTITTILGTDLISNSRSTINTNFSNLNAVLPSSGNAGAGGASLFVAASNAPALIKARADYTCDGIADDVEINAALAALPAAGGRVILSQGSFTTAATITINATNVHLVGQGQGATSINATTGYNGVTIGNRQASGQFLNFMGIENLAVSLPSGASTKSCIFVDGMAQGGYIKDILTNQGGYGLRLKDLDRCIIENVICNSPRTTGCLCEQGLENTWGTVTFINCTWALSDNSTTGMDWNAASEQGSANPFDRLNIIGCLFYKSAGLTGCYGMTTNVAVRAMNIQGSLFEDNDFHVQLNKLSQIHFDSCSFLNTSGTTTDIIQFNNENSLVTLTSCKLQKATNVFHTIGSVYPSTCLMGQNSNGGSISNVYVGNFTVNSGTDFQFAGNLNVLGFGITVPAATVTLVGQDTTDTLSNKTLAGITIFNSSPAIRFDNSSPKGYLAIATGSGSYSTDAVLDDLILRTEFTSRKILFNTNGGTGASSLAIDNANTKIGGLATRGTTEGTNQLVLFNGTAPAGTLANGASFYAASGEMRVMDAAGNSTLLSPHDHETNEWIFYSKNTVTGKVLRIDMERMMKTLNDKLGGGFIKEFIE